MFKSKEQRAIVSMLYKQHCIPFLAGDANHPVVPDPSKIDFDIDNFGLFGYWLTSNAVSDEVLSRLAAVSEHHIKRKPWPENNEKMKGLVTSPYGAVYVVDDEIYTREYLANTRSVNGYRLLSLDFLVRLYENQEIFTFVPWYHVGLAKKQLAIHCSV